MFSLLWRFVPGPVWVRVMVMLAVLAAVVYGLLFYGYPWIASLMETSEDVSTVGGTS